MYNFVIDISNVNKIVYLNKNNDFSYFVVTHLKTLFVGNRNVLTLYIIKYIYTMNILDSS